MPELDLGNVKGPQGKSAYQSALDAGYSGSEEAFNTAMAKASDAVLYTAQSLSDTQKAQARDNIGAAKPTYLGRILRNKIYKIGSFIAGSGESSSGAVTLKICNINEYGFENYMMVFLSYDGACNVEYHGNIGSTNESKVFVYSDPKTTDSAKQFLIFVRTANYADWTTVCIDNEHSFRRDFVDVTDTFSTLVDGLDKLWESQLEYANPPMLLGVEYRTTERYLGKPVYVKVVDCGACPANGYKDVVYGTTGIVLPIRCEGTWSYANRSTIPFESSNEDQLHIGALGGAIRIKTGGKDFSGFTCTATVWYTKTTD